MDLVFGFFFFALLLLLEEDGASVEWCTFWEKMGTGTETEELFGLEMHCYNLFAFTL